MPAELIHARLPESGTRMGQEVGEIILGRKGAQPNKHTFTIPPIKAFVEHYMGEWGRNQHVWLDPFSGGNTLVSWHTSNDLDPRVEAKYCEDALDFLKRWETETVHGVILDPPYSLRQLKECYNSIGIEKLTQKESQLFGGGFIYRDEIFRVLKNRGILLRFGWDSNAISKHFEVFHVLLVNHGGGHHDTICTAQRKIQGNLWKWTE